MNHNYYVVEHYDLGVLDVFEEYEDALRFVFDELKNDETCHIKEEYTIIEFQRDDGKICHW